MVEGRKRRDRRSERETGIGGGGERMREVGGASRRVWKECKGRDEREGGVRQGGQRRGGKGENGRGGGRGDEERLSRREGRKCRRRFCSEGCWQKTGFCSAVELETGLETF